MRWLALLLLPFLLAFEEPLADADAEARAQRLMQEIRCVACENEPISQSAADVAGTMRVRVREMVGEGASDTEVRAWFEERYGEFVLFRPAARGVSGWALWVLPFGLLLTAVAVIVVIRRTDRDDAVLEAVAPETFDHENGAGDGL